MESLWLSGRTSERGIRRSEVRFLVGTRNFFCPTLVTRRTTSSFKIFLLLAQPRGHKGSRPIMILFQSSYSNVGTRSHHFSKKYFLWESRLFARIFVHLIFEVAQVWISFYRFIAAPTICNMFDWFIPSLSFCILAKNHLMVSLTLSVNSGQFAEKRD